MQYKCVPSGDVLGWTKKVASTLIQKAVFGQTCGIHEAWEAREARRNVILVMRHPLDRLVSNYVFWCKTRPPQNVIDIFAKDKGPGDDGPLVFPKDVGAITIEEFYELTQKKYDHHWVDQVTNHTYKGTFVPTVVLPWEVLPTLSEEVVNPSNREGTWEDYFTPEFRVEMEERYMDDLAMYIIAQEAWNGKKPIWFYNSYEEYRVAESAGRNILKGE